MLYYYKIINHKDIIACQTMFLNGYHKYEFRFIDGKVLIVDDELGEIIMPKFYGF